MNRIQKIHRRLMNDAGRYLLVDAMKRFLGFLCIFLVIAVQSVWGTQFDKAFQQMVAISSATELGGSIL